MTNGVPFPSERTYPALHVAVALTVTGAEEISIAITYATDVDFVTGMSSDPQLKRQNYFTIHHFHLMSASI